MSQADPHLAPPPAKRLQILSGARRVFAEYGFERASVDVIAATAGVSKATIYNHYADKTALFVACITQDADELQVGLRACVETPAGDLEPSLRALGEKMMHQFLAPGVVALYRQIIAEVARLPEMGQTLYERGLKVFHEATASYLERWARTGALRLDDARAAAVEFIALCQGDLVSRARLGILRYPIDEEVRVTVARGVSTFVRAYGAPRPDASTAAGAGP